ncbi:MAG: DNA mismatch repair endonuclease MutL, partial [Clostridia bacterium]|nr:DNA mismatch repair endonuclease MutL [Clostridia bacterium]
MKINLLDSSIYNLISAGEVVENPASVVKELVENSIDAGARNVSVYIEDGGIKSIEVVDDGAGIEKDELPKTILPHATSKIKEADDLATISTLGFRGEALASISAVSEFEICSKYFESEHGARLYAKNGVTELTDCAHAQGTSIRVSNLFYNTPARFKFLSSKATEESAVTKHIFRLILSNPEVAINYYVDGNLTYSSSGEGLKSAVESVFLPKIANSLIEVQDDVTEGIRVSGYISPQEIYKNNRNFQIVILNGRVITDQVLSATIQNAYGTRLMSRCFPIYVLNIVMPFDEVDVNVHPNKKEVRFQNARKVYGHVYRVVMRALEGYELQKRQNLIADFSAKSNENEEKMPLFAPIGEQKDDRGTENKKEMSFEEALSLVRGKSSSFASVSESVSTSFIPKQPTFITLEPIAEEKEEVKEAYRETFTPATAPKIEVETMAENEVSTKIFKKVKNYS